MTFLSKNNVKKKKKKNENEKSSTLEDNDALKFT
jgi:hypothetical protein